VKTESSPVVLEPVPSELTADSQDACTLAALAAPHVHRTFDIKASAEARVLAELDALSEYRQKLKELATCIL